MSAAPGWYGKLPCLGDFASRRLARSWIAQWDEWLSGVLAASREALGDGWLDAYLGCPVWRFVLGPGVIDRSSWGGVLMPSVDRVGRYFPLTIAAPLASGNRVERIDLWLDSLAAAALATLDERRPVEALEDDLARLGSLPGSNETLEASPGESLWWRDSEPQAGAIVVKGLPDAAQFRAMLLGGEGQGPRVGG